MKTILYTLISTAILTGCISRTEVNAELWLQSGIEADVCAIHPELQRYGMYRQLKSGEIEFLSYCKQGTKSVQNPDGTSKEVIYPYVQDYTSINTLKLNEFLKALLPKQ